MDSRKKNYAVLVLVIIFVLIALFIAKALGVAIRTGLANAIATIVFYGPIVTFLLYLSSDMQIPKHWRIILKILAVQMTLANIVGIFVFWFT